MSRIFKYENLLDALDRLEKGKYTICSIDWCADCTDWLWKWRKISNEQMENCADRVIKLYEESC